MQIDKAKTAAVITIALLMASIALMAMPDPSIKIVQAQLGQVGSGTYFPGYPNLGPLPPGVTPDYSLDTFAYLSFRPNPIGVGQSLLVNIWSQPGMYHAFYMCQYKVTIQKPDGTTVVVGPMDSYMADATAWFEYVVDQVGTWKFKFEHPGTYIPAGSYVDSPTGQAFQAIVGNFTLGRSVWYKPSSTDWQELEVQQDMVPSWPLTSLPTDYWTRSISPEHREWWTIAGNYPWTGAYYYPGGRVLYSSVDTKTYSRVYKYTPYVQAPNTAHIVWRRQGAMSGLIGGDAYQYSLSSGGGTPSIIFAGRCYQTITKPMLTLVNGTYRTLPTTVWECYDLRTGQVYWDLTDVTAPTFISYEKSTSEPVPGAEASQGYSVYLDAISGGRLLKYSPYTGAVSVNVSISPLTTGTFYMDPYALTVQTINTTGGPGAPGTPTAGIYRLINWTVAGSTANFTARVMSNITWPWSSLGTVDFDAGIAVICDRDPVYAIQWCLGIYMRSADLYRGTELWSYVTNDTLHETLANPSCPVADRGKIAFAAAGRHWTCFDARSGKKLWESELTDYPWGCWFAYATSTYDFNESKGAIIACTYNGLYAIDWDDGKILWHYSSPEVPFESPYSGTQPFHSGISAADGKIYTWNAEHSPSQPVTRGWKLHCINATTGELIWKITGPMVAGAVADGYLTASNTYDGCMYVFGKGKSETTVTASPKAVAKGATIVIEGTVLDQSPGDQGSFDNPTARLDSPTKPGMVPCVSAASMQTLMEYLYMQHPIDGLYHNETVTGVPVILTAIGSDGTVIDIGTVTTNGYYGTFSYAWTPPKEDTYTIMASFAGDDSYGSSTAATGLSVGPAPASPTPTPTPPEAAPDNTPMYILGATIAIIITLAIATLLILRKRP
jgi:hypothetical protein